MRVIVSVCFWVWSVLCLAQNTPQLVSTSPRSSDAEYTQTRVVSLAERRILPLFGELRKTSEQIDAELRFLNDCDKMFTTREEASDFFATRGWEYLQEGQLDTACYRFNLAYLLNDRNVDAYWGLGVVSYQRNELVQAEQILRKGVHLSPDNVPLMVDLATVELRHYTQIGEKGDLEEAHILLQNAVEIDDSYAPAHFGLATAKYYLQEFEGAWRHIHKGRRLDMSLLDIDLVNTLREKLPDPDGFFK